MDTLEAIFTRRSIRRFKAGEVSADTITTILRAGMSAPSAGNEQPWHFLVIRDNNKLIQIPKFSPYVRNVEEVEVAILVCGEPELEKYKDFWIQDCCAAIQNMLLAIHALGLGAVWTGAYPMSGRAEGYRALFDIPETVIPLALILIGVPGEKIDEIDRFNPNRVHKGKW